MTIIFQFASPPPSSVSTEGTALEYRRTFAFLWQSNNSSYSTPLGRSIQAFTGYAPASASYNREGDAKDEEESQFPAHGCLKVRLPSPPHVLQTLSIDLYYLNVSSWLVMVGWLSVCVYMWLFMCLCVFVCESAWLCMPVPISVSLSVCVLVEV